jgi:hypothetical protein
MLQLLVTANVPSSLIVSILMMEVKRRFLQEPHGITSQKMAFFKERLNQQYASDQNI